MGVGVECEPDKERSPVKTQRARVLVDAADRVGEPDASGTEAEAAIRVRARQARRAQSKRTPAVRQLFGAGVLRATARCERLPICLVCGTMRVMCSLFAGDSSFAPELRMSTVTSDHWIGRQWGLDAALGLLFSLLLLPPGEVCARLHRPQELAARETPREEREHEDVPDPPNDDRCFRSLALDKVSPSQIAQAPLLVSPRFSSRHHRSHSGTAGASASQPDALVEALGASASASAQRGAALQPVAVLNPAIFDSALFLLHSSNRLLLQPYELSPPLPPAFTFLAASDSLFGTHNLLWRMAFSSTFLVYTRTSKLIHIVIVIVPLCFILV